MQEIAADRDHRGQAVGPPTETAAPVNRLVFDHRVTVGQSGPCGRATRNPPLG